MMHDLFRGLKDGRTLLPFLWIAFRADWSPALGPKALANGNPLAKPLRTKV
jgi:hypothetical protein